MIKINLNLAITVFLSVSLSLVFIRWILYTFTKSTEKESDQKHLFQCPYCTAVFFSYDMNNKIHICPKCKSYVQKEPDNAKKI